MNSEINQAIDILQMCGYQEHIVEFIHKEMSSNSQSRKLKDLCAQIIKLNKVTPGGLKSYLDRGRDLLEKSAKGVNPFDKFKPEVPKGVFLKPGEKSFDDYELLGVQELYKTGFVLIAGGLGERLGYSGIKIDLPVCTLEDDYCYLKYYVQYAKACKERAMPFVRE